MSAIGLTVKLRILLIMIKVNVLMASLVYSHMYHEVEKFYQ